MIKIAFALCSLLAISNILAQPLCPRSPDVGNYINYLHLFKEEADTLLSFYNAKTSVIMIFEETNLVVGVRKEHKVAFQVVDNNFPQRTWIYAVWVYLNLDDVVIDIYNFAKFRSIPDDCTLTAPFNYPNGYYLKSLFQLPTLPILSPPIICSNSVIKLEYDYFYYMFANYYKTGSGLVRPNTV